MAGGELGGAPAAREPQALREPVHGRECWFDEREWWLREWWLRELLVGGGGAGCGEGLSARTE